MGDTTVTPTTPVDPASRPPSVDVLARSMAPCGLPHPLLVDLARTLVAEGRWHDAQGESAALARTLLHRVVNATGVMLHTNLGRAPIDVHQSGSVNLEFDLETGRRGSRQRAVGALVARACGAEVALIVNNNAAAVLLVLGALARGGEVLVSRGESVEIGGAFRVPEVMEQSGAVLRDVGTTNRTRLEDYRGALSPRSAVILKIHPSNYRVEGFVEETPVAELATLGVPVVADIGSGLLDAACPWLKSGPPPWLADEPAARQTLAAGAALVTFSADKLLGGPQAGVIAGDAALVERCARHPLARALRPGGLVLGALQQTMLAYLRRDPGAIPLWAMIGRPVEELTRRAEVMAAEVNRRSAAGSVGAEAMSSLPGAGSLPGITVPSWGVAVDGDRLAALRSGRTPVIARVRDGRTFVDLRTVEPGDDAIVTEALVRCLDPRRRDSGGGSTPAPGEASPG